MMILSQNHIFELDTINIYSVVANGSLFRASPPRQLRTRSELSHFMYYYLSSVSLCKLSLSEHAWNFCSVFVWSPWSVAWKTHLPSRLTCLADSLTQQTHFPGRFTNQADSLAWQTHLLSRLTCLADSLDQPTHLPSRLTFPMPWQTP